MPHTHAYIHTNSHTISLRKLRKRAFEGSPDPSTRNRTRVNPSLGGDTTRAIHKPALKASTVETIRAQLEFQRWHDPSWFAFHFPGIADRGTAVSYPEVEAMSDREIDSVRQLLANQILHGRKVIWKRKARRVSFLVQTDGDGPADDEWPIRLKQLEEALRDLSEQYGLPYPL